MISFSSIEELSNCAQRLIDVRAPIEFKKGALPGAVNLPILNNDERERVGTCYKQHGQDAAIDLGNQLVSGPTKLERVDAWRAFISQNPDTKIYCFRGGLRSKTAQAWLRDVGIECEVLIGGYKGIRQKFMEDLALSLTELPLVIVGGRTGTGKTSLLSRLPASIDLEGLARHRGSSFGATLQQQPSNVDFEHALTLQFLQHRKQQVHRVFLEDEARMVGRVCIPEVVRQKMEIAPLVLLEATTAERVANVIKDYIIDLCSQYQARDGDELGFDNFILHHQSGLDRVKKRMGGQNHQLVCGLLSDASGQFKSCEDPGVFEPYVQFLLKRYYDPMYDYQLQKKRDRVQFVGNFAEIIKWSTHATS